MYDYGSAIQSLRSKKFAEPSAEDLRVAVTFPGSDGEHGPTKPGVHLSLQNIKDFVPDKKKMDQGINELTKLGFKLTGRGRLTASMRCGKDAFEKVFGTKLKKFQLDTKQNYAFHSLLFPGPGAPWEPLPILKKLIDNAYIQWPQIYLAPTPSVKPPKVDYYHLNVSCDVASLLNATQLHRAGNTGKGIRVVMIDTGFAHSLHPFFAANGFKSTVHLAPGAMNDKTDPFGHGTGESANFFSVAPDATFIGVKVDNDDDPRRRSSMLEAFQLALQHHPHIISISKCSDLRDEKSSIKQRSTLPNSLKALEAEILYAIASGIIVVFSAGNGEFAFPAMMPDVIAVGGVFVDQDHKMQASDLASAFDSRIYSGRHVPDFCGLVGMKTDPIPPYDRYIMLPIPARCEIDKVQSENWGDGTKPDDGWAAFSGTSAAAPQIAGVCALLKEKDPKLTPWQIKKILRDTARKVSVGHSNPKCSDDGKTPLKAVRGNAGAAGAGLVNAFRAWQRV